jgi:hypothetical protein
MPGGVLNIFVDVKTASAENDKKTIEKMYTSPVAPYNQEMYIYF